MFSTVSTCKWICLSTVPCPIMSAHSQHLFWAPPSHSHNSVVRVTLRSFLSGALTCQGERGFSALWSDVVDVMTVVLAFEADDILRVTCLVPVKDVSCKDKFSFQKICVQTLLIYTWTALQTIFNRIFSWQWNKGLHCLFNSCIAVCLYFLMQNFYCHWISVLNMQPPLRYNLKH